MKDSQPSGKFHIFAISTGAVLVGIFLWSTLNTFAFNGPTANPPTGNGALSSDSSNNVYVGGNLNVTGTISSPNNFTGDISAANISAGTFGSNTGGGSFTFGYGGVNSEGGYGVESTGTSQSGWIEIEDSAGDWMNNDATGDLDIYADQNLNLGAGSGVYADLTIASSGYVGIGTLTSAPPVDLFTVNGTSSADAYCFNGANCITAWPSGGGSGANPTASIGTSAVNGSATTFMRSDAAPAINQAATFSFSALGNTTSTGNISAKTITVTNTSTLNGNIDSNINSALLLTNGTGVVGAYGGASACSSGNAVTAISATGGTTCSSFATSTVTGANPTGQIGTSAVNGSATTFMRSDAAPAINQAATFAFSALGNTTSTGNFQSATLHTTGAMTVSSTLGVQTAVNVTGPSSTIRLGTSGNASHGCIELYDAVQSTTIDYIYASSDAAVFTTTKPAWCE